MTESTIYTNLKESYLRGIEHILPKSFAWQFVKFLNNLENISQMHTNQLKNLNNFTTNMSHKVIKKNPSNNVNIVEATKNIQLNNIININENLSKSMYQNRNLSINNYYFDIINKLNFFPDIKFMDPNLNTKDQDDLKIIISILYLLLNSVTLIENDVNNTNDSRSIEESIIYNDIFLNMCEGLYHEYEHYEQDKILNNEESMATNV